MSDTLEGGAAAATNRLVDALTQRPSLPFERWHFTAQHRATSALERSLDARAKRPAGERLIKNISRSLADRLRRQRHRRAFLRAVETTRPALLNLHCLHTCGIDHSVLDELPTNLPMLWTLHDCWPFRPVAFEWENSTTGEMEAVCAEQPPSVGAMRRQAFFHHRPGIILVAPSRWMATQARAYVPSSVRIEHVPYGLDIKTFHPQPQLAAQNALGLASGKTWLGYGATWASSRKGIDLLPAALGALDCRSLGLLVWGEDPQLTWPQGLTVKFIGRVSGVPAIRQVLAACDLLLCPSRADNLPNAVLESLACGTPVIGSNAGGIPDMVRPSETGWTFPSGQVTALQASLTEALASRALWPAYRERCRQVAVTEYSEEVQAERYHRLFSELRRD